jgi:hypothetical protein
MAFGKRNGFGSGSAAQAAPQPEQRKVFPDELWEGKTGNLLRELGMKPDDPANLVPTVDTVNARNARDKAAFEEKLAKINLDIAARTQGGVMRGFSLLPDPCWTGEMGHLLMLRLNLFPYEDWNLVLLPADQKTALFLDLPPHPNHDIPLFVSSAEKFLKDADAALRAAHAEAGLTQDFAKFGDAHEAIRNKVKGLAATFLASMDEAWKNQKPALESL